jgi:hypothetical protein
VYGQFTGAAAARILGVSRGRVTQLVREGKLSRVWLDGRAFISGYSLKALINDRGEIGKVRKDGKADGRFAEARRLAR